MKISKKLVAVTAGLSLLFGGTIVMTGSAAATTDPYYVVAEFDTVNANSSLSLDAICDTGDFATGGGYRVANAVDLNVRASAPYTPGDVPRGWTAEVDNNDGTSRQLNVYVVCADVA